MSKRLTSRQLTKHKSTIRVLFSTLHVVRRRTLCSFLITGLTIFIVLWCPVSACPGVNESQRFSVPDSVHQKQAQRH